jgi:hypothetical protein
LTRAVDDEKRQQNRNLIARESQGAAFVPAPQTARESSPGAAYAPTMPWVSEKRTVARRWSL